MLGKTHNNKVFQILTTVFFCLFFVLPAHALTPNDPDLDEQWYLDQISAYVAWDQTTGSNTVIVAVPD